VSRAAPGAGPAGEASGAGRAGLLAKLVAAVRPEFRAEVLVFDPADPVFGGPPCRVSGCARVGWQRGLCDGHYQRWSQDGRPDPAAFAVAAGPPLQRWRPSAPCRVAGCRYCTKHYDLCSRHYYVWGKAGKPELGPWLAAPPPVAAPADPSAACRVPSCALWPHAGTPFCRAHSTRWRAVGQPDAAEFAAACEADPDPRMRVDLRGLDTQLRLEVQYALQRRRDEGKVKAFPGDVGSIVRFLAGSGATSLLDWPEQTLRQQFPRRPRDSAATLLAYTRAQVEDLAHGTGWDVEYPRDVWRLRKLGVAGPHARLYFGRIPQPWLRELAKRWLRWRLAGGISGTQAHWNLAAVTRFAAFLAAAAPGATSLAQVDRALLERYLAALHAGLAGSPRHGRYATQLGMFFQALRQHQWDTSLPAGAVFFPEDQPKQPRRLPRALPEHVMAQLETPANLDLWPDPAHRLATLIMIRCGLRVSDALRLPHDCVAHDADGAPYLRYYNHKMKREALVPIDAELERGIAEQQARVLGRWPDCPILFPQPTANLDGRKPVNASTYRPALYRWLQRCDIRDEHGRPAHLTPHQWRHTLGTRLINRDVPQEVVRRILDHDSHAMTAHYARLSDTTIRRHWEQARKVGATGEPVTLDPDGPLADAAWAKQRLGRATQALPNGYCGLPVQKTCPHANACLTCPMFITTAEFLPQHRAQHQQTLQIISAAEARGQRRLAEMNRQVAGNLEKIITALQEDTPREAVADAS
jgi:integrase